MAKEVLQYELKKETLIRIADKKLDNNDFYGALNVLFNALENYKKDCDIYERIALALANLKMNFLSNKYLFLYLKYTKNDTVKKIYKLLSFNYFKMNEHLLSLYYARFLYDDELSESVIDEVSLFEGISENIENYMLRRYVSVYPDNSKMHALNVEDGMKYFILTYYDKAIEKLSKVPLHFKNLENQNALCESYLRVDDEQEFLKACKETIDFYGRNIKTFSLLYEFYSNEKNLSKTEYYYSQMKELFFENKLEYEGIIYSAVKQNDHELLCEVLQRKVKEKPENIEYLYLLGKVYINIGKYDLAKKCFIELLKFDRQNFMYDFYLNFSNDLLFNSANNKILLPLSYEENLPLSVIKKSCKNIRKNIEIIYQKKKPSNALNDVKCALYDKIALEDAVHLICLINKSEYYDVLEEFFLNPFIPNGDKVFAIVLLTIYGYNKEISFTFSGIFKKIKTRKVLFDQSDFGKLITDAYITSAIFLLSNSCFSIDKLIFNANKIFKKFNEISLQYNVSEKELTCALIILSNDIFIDRKYICKRFKVKFDRVLQYVNLIKGNKNDKNN